MRARRLIVLALGVAGLAAAGAWYWWSSRALRGPGLVSTLPQDSGVIAYFDVEALRKAGVLDLIAGARGSEDADYRRFAESTGFDYRRDLDGVALASRRDEYYFALRGRFDLERIRRYTTAQGGTCQDQFCKTRGSEPGRWVSFYPLKRDVLAMASSPNEIAALEIAPRSASPSAPVLPAGAPVVARVRGQSLENARLPSGTQSFASPLSGARDILLAVRPRTGEFDLALEVTCNSEDAASELLVKLEGATSMLRKLIARENLKPSRRDLSGVLTSGTFRREGFKVYGSWPIAREFVESLASGAIH